MGSRRYQKYSAANYNAGSPECVIIVGQVSWKHSFTSFLNRITHLLTYVFQLDFG